MFPPQPSNDLVFGPPTTSQSYQILGDDLVTDHDFLDNNLISFSIGSNDGESRKKTENRPIDESSSRKVMHKEVEKKRRQEMSNLYSSLRSILPDEGIKGKRSVCDQMQEAASQIKKMEKNIEELKTRRDKLMGRSSGGDGGGDDYVTVNLATVGVEILISRSINASDLGLSRVFAELQRIELDVVSSVSTRMNERFVHKILVEAREMTNLGVLELQERLIKAIKQ